MSKLLKLAAASVLCCLVLVLNGCPKKVDATANCKHLEKYQSGFGVFNAPDFSPGDVLAFNPNAVPKTGYFLQHVSIVDSDTSTTPPIDHTEIISDADFDLNTSVTLPQGIDAQLKTDIASNTLFSLSNYSRQQINDPTAVLNKDQAVIEKIKGLPAGQFAGVVFAVVKASDAQFKLKDATTVQAGVQLKRYGNYQVTVTYSCQGSLSSQAQKPAGIFFKVYLVRYDSGSGKVVVDTSTVLDLKDYSLVHTLM